MPPASRNQRVPTGGDTPAPIAASSLDRPAAINAQKRSRSSRRAIPGRPGDLNLSRNARSDRRLPAIATFLPVVLRRPFDSAPDPVARWGALRGRDDLGHGRRQCLQLVQSTDRRQSRRGTILDPLRPADRDPAPRRAVRAPRSAPDLLHSGLGHREIPGADRPFAQEWPRDRIARLSPRAVERDRQRRRALLARPRARGLSQTCGRRAAWLAGAELRLFKTFAALLARGGFQYDSSLM